MASDAPMKMGDPKGRLFALEAKAFFYQREQGVLVQPRRFKTRLPGHAQGLDMPKRFTMLTKRAHDAVFLPLHMDFNAALSHGRETRNRVE